MNCRRLSPMYYQCAEPSLRLKEQVSVTLFWANTRFEAAIVKPNFTTPLRAARNDAKKQAGNRPHGRLLSSIQLAKSRDLAIGRHERKMKQVVDGQNRQELKLHLPSKLLRDHVSTGARIPVQEGTVLGCMPQKMLKLSPTLPSVKADASSGKSALAGC